MKKNMIKGVFAASIVLSMLSCNNIADSTFVSDSVTVSRASGVAESVVETAVLTSDLNPGFGYAVYFTGDFANHWGYAYRGTYSEGQGWTYTVNTKNSFEWKALVGPYDAGSGVNRTFNGLTFKDTTRVNNSNPVYYCNTNYGQGVFFASELEPTVAYRGTYENGSWTLKTHLDSASSFYYIYIGDWSCGEIVNGYFKDLTWSDGPNNYYEYNGYEPDGKIGYQEFYNNKATVTKQNSGKVAYLVVENQGPSEASKYGASISYSPANNELLDDVIIDKNLKPGKLVKKVTARNAVKSYNVGDTKDTYLYYKGKRETATVKYTTEHANIWFVPSENYPSFSDSKFKQYGDTFEKIYAAETQIFGDEEHKYTYSNIIDWDKSQKVNIVFWDMIGSGAGGYFFSGDFFKNYVAGNDGHYLYIWSEYLNDPTSSLNTMVHEFQHLLCYVQSYVNSGLKDCSSWYTEMLSVLSEDLFRNIGGYTDGGSTRWPYNNFNISDDDNYMKYRNGYLYGAFLLRNFGGIDFLKAMTHSGKVDEEAVTYALHKMGYVDEDYYSVLRKASMAFIDTSRDGEYSLNKTYSDGGILNLCIEPINLGTVYYSYAYQPKVWGRWFSIKKLGTANYGSTYTLNNDGDYGLNYYILYK